MTTRHREGERDREREREDNRINGVKGDIVKGRRGICESENYPVLYALGKLGGTAKMT